MFSYFVFNKMRRKIRLKIFRLIQRARIVLYQIISVAKVKGKPRLNQPLHAVGDGLIEFSGLVRIGFFPSPFFLSSCAYIEARSVEASIFIGSGTRINNGFSAIAEHTSIKIGRNVLIGTNVEIYDSDFHGLSVESRGVSRSEWAKSVLIEDNVFLGSNVRILKGVTIGQGSVIANSSVVVKDIPPNVIAGGNPARVLREI